MMTLDACLQQKLKDPEFKKEYDRLAPRYEIISQLIKARLEMHLTQQELAEKTGLRQSNISRFEHGNYNPSLDFLEKLAAGLGKTIRLNLK